MVMTHVDEIPGTSVKLNTIDKHFKTDYLQLPALFQDYAED